MPAARKKVAKKKPASSKPARSSTRATPAKRPASIKPSASTNATPRSTADEVNAILASLQKLSDPRIRDEMGPRYGIHTDKAMGMRMSVMQKFAKNLKKSRAPDDNHRLAAALWDTGWYEARTIAAFVDEPTLLTPAQMDRWCRDFDNWGICDTVCFKLFDRVAPSLAFAKIDQWSRGGGKHTNDEFIKRAAFALLACVALHDKNTDDEPFLQRLPLIERAVTDPNEDRNFVKKGVSWALRSIGRRSSGLRAPSLDLARRLADSPHPTAKWVGKDALRELTGRR